MKARVLIPARPKEAMPEEPEHKFQVVKDFKAVNTKADRTAIKTEEFAWLENIIPQGFGNLQIVPTYGAIDAFGFTWTGTVDSLYYFSVIDPVTHSAKDYLVAFKTDGSAQYKIVGENSFGVIGSGAGTFSNTGVQISVWNAQYLVIIDPVKGLFVWDTNVLEPVGSVGLITVTNGGTGYTFANVTISNDPSGGSHNATAQATITGGVITSITITDPGWGYFGGGTTVTITGDGTGATAIASLITFANNTISGATVTARGTGYVANFAVTFGGGGGSGGAATAIVRNGGVDHIVITNFGSGYTGTPSVNLSAGAGTGAAATAIVNFTPNVGVAVFAGRLWVAYGRSISYSSALHFTDFITVSSGTVNFTDSTLRGPIVNILPANNFLYGFGADSVNVVSDVTVNTSGVTLLTNTTVSSSIGTAFPYAIFNYFRSVLFMNQYGIYALVGATASKISDDLDGVFKNIDFTRKITSGQVVVNNQLCAAFNFYYNDPRTLTSRYIQALYFEKKWWFSSQSTAVTQVAAGLTGGNIVMYGTSGSNVVLLYSNTTLPINWTLITALWPMESVMQTKQALRFGVELRTGVQGVIMTATVDNENVSSAPITLYNAVQWVNNQSIPVQWQNNASQIVDWLATGYQLYEHDAPQYGKYIGLTLTGSSPAFTITGDMMEYTLNEPWK